MSQVNISVETIANLLTMQLANNNTAQPFYFDRQPGAPFKVPKGYSFVITDVIVNPQVTSFAAGQFFLVVVTADGGRSITVQSDGHMTHLALASGLVVPEPSTPSPGAKGLMRATPHSARGPLKCSCWAIL